MHTKAISLTLALALLSPLAFGQISFVKFDANDDGVISQVEFENAANQMGLFDRWDLNNDGLIDENEFNNIGLNGDFNTWDVDGDGYLDEDEFYDGIFDTYDDTEDGHWQEGEWDDAGEAGLLDF